MARRELRHSDLVKWIEKAEFAATTHVTDSKIHLVENVVAQPDSGPIDPDFEADPNDERRRGWDLMPWHYDDDLATPSDERPQIAGSFVEPRIVRWAVSGDKTMKGSAMEQTWRQIVKTSVEEVNAAEERAESLLLKFLSPAQRLDYFSTDNYFLQRGKLNRFYRVEFYNGLEVVKPVLLKQTFRNGYIWRRIIFRILYSICFHPDVWIPGQDTMLASKLMIENDEATLLTAGNVRELRTPIYFSHRPAGRPLDHLLLDRDGKLVHDLRKRKPEPNSLLVRFPLAGRK